MQRERFFKYKECLITYSLYSINSEINYLTSFSLEGVKDFCYIEQIETKENFRKRGYAKAALKKFIKKMKLNKIETILLTAVYDEVYYKYPDNNGLLRLVKFYESFGFIPKEKKFSNGDYIDMRLDISS